MLCSSPPKTATDNDKSPKATSSKSGHVAALLAQFCIGACSAVSPRWRPVPQAVAPFLQLCCTPFSSARVGLAQLSSSGLGSLQLDWSHPHQPIPGWHCHPTPINLHFTAFPSAPHPLTALWRKVQRDLQGSRGIPTSTGANPNIPTARERKRQNSTCSGAGSFSS